VLPILARFRLAAYVLGATAVVELLRAAARVRAAPDLPRSPDVAWGLVAAAVAIAAGYGARRRRGWAPAAFAAAALAYLGRAVSVGAQVWQRFPDRRALAFVPVGAGLLFTGVALWLAWGAARASARDT
jgi:hypothetical protein